MKNIIIGFFCVCFCMLFSFQSNAQKYHIDIELIGNSDSTAYLAHYYDGRIFADDTTQLVNGKGTFAKQKQLDEGIYVIYLPSQKYFDLLIGKDQEFAITADPKDFIGSIQIKGSEESKAFHDFQQFMKNQNANSKKIQEAYKANKDNPQEKEKYQAAFKKADNEVRSYIKQLHVDYTDDQFVSKFAQFTLSPKIPDFSEEVAESAKDRDEVIRRKSYLYNKNHYFDMSTLRMIVFSKHLSLKTNWSFSSEKYWFKIQIQ